MTLRPTTHPKNAFTLIELLVVISIISLLIALLLPALAAVREQANRVTCSSNMRQMGASLTMYDEDYDNLPPGRYNVPTHINQSAHSMVRDHYGVSLNITTCPSSLGWTHNTYLWTNDSTAGRLTYWYFAGWGARGESTSNLKDGVNDMGWLASTFPERDSGYHAVATLKREMPHGPSKQFLMFDLDYTVQPHSQMPLYGNHIVNETIDGSNALFADNHVEWHPLRTGVSWNVAGSHYWTPGGAIPSGATVY